MMIDKLTGRIAYAILSFGGFLGIGEDHYPILWSMLTYNEKPDGFQLDITEEQLKNALKIEQGENWEQTNRTRNQDVYESPILLACGIGGIRHSNSVLNGAQ